MPKRWAIIKVLAWMLEKDLKLFWRDRRTFMLVLLAPVFIMFVLSNIFNVSDTSQSIKGITVGVCNLDEKSLDLKTDVFNVMMLNGQCSEDAKKLVERGELRISVIVPQGFFEDIQTGHGSNLTTYVDNSKGQIALVSTAAIKAYVAELNEEIGTAFILAAWDSLSELNDNLKLLISHLDEGITLTQKAQARTQRLQINLSDINTTQVRQSLHRVNDTLEISRTHLERARALLILSSIIPMNASFNSSPLLDFQSSYCVNFTQVNGTPFENLSENAWEQMCSPLQQAIIAMESLQNQNQSLNETELLVLVDTTYNDVLLMQEDLSQILLLYEEILALRESSENEIIRFNDILDNYTKQMVQLRNDLSKTTFILDDYTSRNPENIIHAVTLYENKVFGGRKILSFMLPGIVALILLFITMFISSSVIVSERRSGTMARNFLSPISTLFFLFEKTVYLLVLSAIQLVSMTLTSYILGVPIAWSLSLFIVALVVSFSFISLGILIGSFSKTENTALLTSLVLGLPMLFLSGLFFPFEIMPAIMRTIGSYLPLTLSIANLNRILVYGLSLHWYSLGLLFVISLVLFFAAAFLMHRRPTVD